MTLLRAKSGVPGFDDVIGGGFPRGFLTVITGAPGSCKTIFSLQFAVNGILQNQENAVYVGVGEDSGSALRAQASSFGWDLEALERQGKLGLVLVPVTTSAGMVFDLIRNKVHEIGAQRLVVDSLSALSINAPSYWKTAGPEKASSTGGVDYTTGRLVEFERERALNQYSIQQFIYIFAELVKELRLTSILITDAGEPDGYRSRDGVSEYIGDGLVLLRVAHVGSSVVRLLEVVKMRGTSHDLKIHPLELSNAGLNVRPATP